MSAYNPREQQPVRREMTDPRSCAGPSPQLRRTILNDSRSTRGRPG